MSNVVEIGWKETPEEERIKAYRLEHGVWTECHYRDLKIGDVFKAINAQGLQIDTVSYEPDPESFNICVSEPYRHLEQCGWCVVVDSGPLGVLTAAGNHTANSPGPGIIKNDP